MKVFILCAENTDDPSIVLSLHRDPESAKAAAPVEPLVWRQKTAPAFPGDDEGIGDWWARHPTDKWAGYSIRVGRLDASYDDGWRDGRDSAKRQVEMAFDAMLSDNRLLDSERREIERVRDSVRGWLAGETGAVRAAATFDETIAEGILETIHRETIAALAAEKKP